MGHNPHKSVSRLLYTPRRQKVTLTGKERPPGPVHPRVVANGAVIFIQICLLPGVAAAADADVAATCDPSPLHSSLSSPL